MKNNLTDKEVAKFFNIKPEEVKPGHYEVIESVTKIIEGVWVPGVENPTGAIPSRPFRTQPTSTIEHRGNSTIKPTRPKTGTIQHRGGAPKKRKRVIVDTNKPLPERKTDVFNPIMHDLLITLGILGGMVLVAIIIMKLWQ